MVGKLKLRVGQKLSRFYTGVHNGAGTRPRTPNSAGTFFRLSSNIYILFSMRTKVCPKEGFFFNPWTASLKMLCSVQCVYADRCFSKEKENRFH